MFLLTVPILLLASPVSVLACEGECIAGITSAWLRNYTSPLYSVFQLTAEQISQKLFPHESHHDSMLHLQPIISAYNSSSYDGMERAIFPSYFHGKCQRNGVDPPGCPIPDCPVVCGTPGSLVHFFPTLRFIAFNYTRGALQQLCSPGHEAYTQAERSVVQTAAASYRRGDERRWFEYMISGAGGELAPRKNFPSSWKREESVKKEFEAIMREVPKRLEQACGGDPSEDVNALPGCSWEARMKAFIHTFP